MDGGKVRGGMSEAMKKFMGLWWLLHLRFSLISDGESIWLEYSIFCTDSITGWENGRSEPQIHFYPRIIDFLGYNPFETSKETIGARIKAYWLTHGLSQKKMRKLLSVDGSTICSWENGITVPNKIMPEKVNTILHNEATWKGASFSNKLLC